MAALASSGISDAIIINQMHTTGARFKLCAEDILFLKKNNVSDCVVIEMQNSRNRQEPIGMPLPMPVYDNPMPMPHADLMPYNPWMQMPAPAPVPPSHMAPAYYNPSCDLPMPQPSYQPMPTPHLPMMYPQQMSQPMPNGAYGPVPANYELPMMPPAPLPYYQPPMPAPAVPHYYYAPPALPQPNYAAPTTGYDPALDGPVPYSPYGGPPAPQPAYPVQQPLPPQSSVPTYSPYTPQPTPQSPPGYSSPQLPPQSSAPNCQPGAGPCPVVSATLASLLSNVMEDPTHPAEFPLKPQPHQKNGVVKARSPTLRRRICPRM